MFKPSRITDCAKAFLYIQEGRVVAFPTGTSYGLAVDALQGNALQRLRNLKQRSQSKTFTVFMDPSLVKTCFALSVAEEKALQEFEGQAITMLLKPTSKLAHLAQEGRVGLRLIDHPLMKALASIAQTPLTATSANISDQPSCHTPACIQKIFPWHQGDQVYDLSLATILDGGTLPQTKPSTIIQVTDKAIKIIRPGAVVIP